MLCFQGNENHHRHHGGAGQQAATVAGTEAEGSHLKPQSRMQKEGTGNGDFEASTPTRSDLILPSRPNLLDSPKQSHRGQSLQMCELTGTFSSKPPHSLRLSWPSISHWAPSVLLISWPTFQSSSHCADQSFSCPADPYFFACPLNTVFPVYISAVCLHGDPF